jgi:hypothetical protein
MRSGPGCARVPKIPAAGIFGQSSAGLPAVGSRDRPVISHDQKPQAKIGTETARQRQSNTTPGAAAPLADFLDRWDRDWAAQVMESLFAMASNTE